MPAGPRRGRLAVLGRGRLGTSLAEAAGAPLYPASGRPAGRSLRLQSGDLAFLAVPDQAVAGLAARLAPGLPEGAALVHLAGALPLTVLEPAARRGSFHPLQSFPAPRAPSHWHGVTVAVDASDADLLDQLEQLALQLGAKPRRVTDAERLRYHAAGVLAGNYLVGLAHEATQLLVGLGWSPGDALAALLPLMRGSLDNLDDLGLPNALIGPVRRGDAATVSRQLAELRAANPGSVEVYRILGLSVLAVAREGGLDEAAARKVEQALTA